MLHPIVDELPTEVPFCEKMIVGRAQDSKILAALASATSPRLVVMDLGELGLAATLSIVTYERATQTVALGDLSLGGVRDEAT